MEKKIMYFKNAHVFSVNARQKKNNSLCLDEDQDGFCLSQEHLIKCLN